MIRVLGFFAWAVFLGLWIVIARTDWQHKKIRHPHLLFGAAAALLGYALQVGVTLLGIFGHVREFYYWSFYGAAVMHSVLCAFAAMALWRLRVWPAGDAKLFVLLGTLYPLVEGSFVPERLFLVLLINTFLPAAGFLFARAAWYVFDTRLRSSRAFLASLGWRRELEYLASLAAGRAKEQAAAVRERLAAAGRLPWKERASAAGAAVLGLVPKVGQWLTGMVFTTLVSYALRDFLENPLLLALLCTGVFMLWGRVRAALGPAAARGLVAAAGAALLAWSPPDWSLLGKIAANVSVFSFFLFLGMSSATGLIMGGVASAVSWVFPLIISFLFMGLGWAAARAWEVLASLWQWLLFAARDAASSSQGLLPSLRTALTSALNQPATLRPGWFGDLAPHAATLALLAALGAFFGLCLVLVRLWEDEVRPTQKSADLAPNLVLADSFVDRLREDPEFFDAHFEQRYADGLTLEQAEALKLWCASRGIEQVPVATTVSFASWIFVGALVSLLLGGRQLLQAVF